MIEFYYETDFRLSKSENLAKWISGVISHEGFDLGEIAYIFCDDAYLHQLNVEFLKHDTFTDIISFDNSVGNEIGGEIYISVERVRENAAEFGTSFEEELHRVMIHGILHYCGYKDKSSMEAEMMRNKEDEALRQLSEA